MVGECPMTTVVLSDEGQVPLPADLRRRLGLGAGVRLELSEESDWTAATRSSHTSPDGHHEPCRHDQGTLARGTASARGLRSRLAAGAWV